MSSNARPYWRAGPGCPDGLRNLIEKTVNAYPPRWIDEPRDGEVFESIDECHRRLIAYSFSQGFDVVKTHTNKGQYPNATFCCCHHSEETRNTRDLPDKVERDEEGQVIGERQRELTIVRQALCLWCCKVAWKFTGKRGQSPRAWVLAVKDLSHSHSLANNPFIYRQHKERSDEYKILKAQARAHRVSVLPYSTSRRVLDAVDGTGLTLSRREYYNLQKYQTLDGRDTKTIDGLVYALDTAEFIHRYRVEKEYDAADPDKVVSKKLIQIWFTHPKLIQIGARYAAAAVCIIDATFNTNKARMPIIVAVGVLANGKTFPIAFSYIGAEDHESYVFFWQMLKEYWPFGTAMPSIVVSDQGGAILSSIKQELPQAQHQICEWHAVEAMCAKFRQFHTSVDIQGGKDREGNEIKGLKNFAWAYIKSATMEDLESNRQALYNHLKAPARQYISEVWGPKECRVIRCYTRLFFNLGMHSSQRVESYHVVLKDMTNGQLSLENSATALARTITRLIEDMDTERDNELKAYTRLAQAAAFSHLRMNITNFALIKIALEWDDLYRLMDAAVAPETPQIGNCDCSILRQFGLPCVHYLQPYWYSGQPIPRSLCHPRWWLNGSAITSSFWGPYSDYLPGLRAIPQPIFSSSERRIMELREELQPEQRDGFDRQRARRQELLDQQTLQLAQGRLQQQRGLPIMAPDPVQRGHFTAQARARANAHHTRLDARAPTANELGQRRQQQEARQQAEQVRIRVNEERYSQLQLQLPEIEDPFNDTQLTTISVAPAPIREPTTPPPQRRTLPIRTPPTVERPRPRAPSESLTPSPLRPAISEPPASTAPPVLGRGKRRRAHTSKYEQARAQGDIDESQEVHKAERG